jgi:hypothetical protein
LFSFSFSFAYFNALYSLSLFISVSLSQPLFFPNELDKKQFESKAPDRKPTNQPDYKTPNSANKTFQVRILIPMGASGVMIGRQGI